jgi:hypothetical protein
MKYQFDPESLNYEPCVNDEGWVRCQYCYAKVYAGENKTDIVRHAERCQYR